MAQQSSVYSVFRSHVRRSAEAGFPILLVLVGCLVGVVAATTDLSFLPGWHDAAYAADVEILPPGFDITGGENKGPGCCVCHYTRSKHCAYVNQMKEDDGLFPSGYAQFQKDGDYDYYGDPPTTKKEACAKIKYKTDIIIDCEWRESDNTCISRFETLCDSTVEQWKKDNVCAISPRKMPDSEIDTGAYSKFIEANACMSYPTLQYVRYGHGRDVEAFNPITACIACGASSECTMLSNEFGCGTLQDRAAVDAKVLEVQKKMIAMDYKGTVYLRADQATTLLTSQLTPLWISITRFGTVIQYPRCSDITMSCRTLDQTIQCTQDGKILNYRCCDRNPTDLKDAYGHKEDKQYVAVDTPASQCPASPAECPENTQPVWDISTNAGGWSQYSCSVAIKRAEFEFKNFNQDISNSCIDAGGTFLEYGKQSLPEANQCTQQRDNQVSHLIMARGRCCMSSDRKPPVTPPSRTYEPSNWCDYMYQDHSIALWNKNESLISGEQKGATCDPLMKKAKENYQSTRKDLSDKCLNDKGRFTVLFVDWPVSCLSSVIPTGTVYEYEINGMAQCCSQPPSSPSSSSTSSSDSSSSSYSSFSFDSSSSSDLSSFSSSSSSSSSDYSSSSDSSLSFSSSSEYPMCYSCTSNSYSSSSSEDAAFSSDWSIDSSSTSYEYSSASSESSYDSFSSADSTSSSDSSYDYSASLSSSSDSSSSSEYSSDYQDAGYSSSSSADSSSSSSYSYYDYFFDWMN